MQVQVKIIEKLLISIKDHLLESKSLGLELKERTEWLKIL